MVLFEAVLFLVVLFLVVGVRCSLVLFDVGIVEFLFVFSVV